MLIHLNVRDYALIDRLELDFGAGFTVLTGETGAGKSILIEALGLALGDRADAGVVRQGAERAEVVATVELGGNEPARRWLAGQSLDDGDEAILRRVVGADGRSKAFINGSPAPLASLRALGALLIDVHGQHEHHALLEREHQLALLDGYAGHPELTLVNVPTAFIQSGVRLLKELGTYVLSGGTLDPGDLMQLRADLPFLVGITEGPEAAEGTLPTLRVVLLA